MMVGVCCFPNFELDRFPANADHKVNALAPPHHLHCSPLLCLYLCGDLLLICPSLSIFPILSWHLYSALLHAAMVLNSVPVFICVIPYPTMHYNSPPLACPVLFCSAPNLFPFHRQCPSFPPLSLCCGILLIFSSLAGQGATGAEERGGEGGRNVC